jgi:predicted nucleic acid-binding protein
MIILDTDVMSALMRPAPEKAVADWLDLQSPVAVWTTAITIMELRFGIQILPEGKKRSRLLEEFDAVLVEDIGERIVAFDVVAARHTANLMADRQKRGRPVELRDTMIAGIALAHDATIATRKTAHFRDLSVSVINPWVA